MITVLKSKIHRATVTDCNIEYNGSITIDEQLMKAAKLVPFEQVHVSNISNGNRFITYVIPGDRGTMIVNGAAAHLVSKGDKIIVMAYETIPATNEEIHPKLVFVRDDNQIQATEI